MDILVRGFSVEDVQRLDFLAEERGQSRQKFLKDLIDNSLLEEKDRCSSCGAELETPIRIRGQRESYCQGCFGAAIGEHIINGVVSGMKKGNIHER